MSGGSACVVSVLVANYESAERRLDRVIAENSNADDTDWPANESGDGTEKKRSRR